MNSKFRLIVKSIKSKNLVWRYGYNLSPTLKYVAEAGNRLNLVEKNIVKRLNKDGIAFSTVNELLGETSLFQELDLTTNNIIENKKEEIARLRLGAHDEVTVGNKTFNVELLESELTFDADSVFARFALNQALLNIANSYFQMYAKLRYYNVWKTFASNGHARESQLWHFDREDRYILKVFLYLDDVEDGTGPFTYAPGTHKKGGLKNLQPEFFMEGRVQRTTDEQMHAVYPKERWIKGIGKKGTIVFADTRGFHKGGEARTKDRLMYTCMYTSSASESKKLIKYPPFLDTKTLSKKQLKALFF